MRIAVTGNVEEAEATKWTGDPETDAGNGELTVTPAHEAVARDRIPSEIRARFFIKT
jgi:hypothetical protein